MNGPIPDIPDVVPVDEGLVKAALDCCHGADLEITQRTVALYRRATADAGRARAMLIGEGWSFAVYAILESNVASAAAFRERLRTLSSLRAWGLREGSGVNVSDLG